MRSTKYSLLVFLFTLFSCKQEHKYFNFNGDTFKATPVIQTFEEISFSTVKVPTEYLIKNPDSLKLFEKNEVLIYDFIASDGSNVLKTRTEVPFDDVIRYFSQNINNDFTAYDETGAIIPCIGVVHERVFGAVPFQRLVLHFDKPSISPITKLIYIDRLFGSGRIVHQFNNQDIDL